MHFFFLVPALFIWGRCRERPGFLLQGCSVNRQTTDSTVLCVFGWKTAGLLVSNSATLFVSWNPIPSPSSQAGKVYRMCACVCVCGGIWSPETLHSGIWLYVTQPCNSRLSSGSKTPAKADVSLSTNYSSRLCPSLVSSLWLSHSGYLLCFALFSCLPLFLPACPSLCKLAYLSVCRLSACLHLLPVLLSGCLPACSLSASWPVCLPVCLSTYLLAGWLPSLNPVKKPCKFSRLTTVPYSQWHSSPPPLPLYTPTHTPTHA